MKKLALLLGLVLIVPPAYSADWMVVDDDIEIDMESIQKRYIKGKAHVGAWTRTVTRGRATAQNLRWYHCKNKTMSYLPSSSMTFDHLGRLKANETRQRQLTDLQFVDIPPGTVTEMIYDIACASSLMRDVVTDNNITQSDINRLRQEYHDNHFTDVREFILDKISQTLH